MEWILSRFQTILTKHLIKRFNKISVLNFIFKSRLCSELYKTNALMVSVHHLLSLESERDFVYIFFHATIVNNLFDNPVLFKNVEILFLINSMTHNRNKFYLEIN